MKLQSLPIVLLLASCATIMTGSTDSVLLTTTPSGAEFRTHDGQSGVTPATVVVVADQDLVVDFDLEGYRPVQGMLRHRMSGWIWGNILFGGLIGLIVDLANSKSHTHDGQLAVNLTPLGPEPPEGGPEEAPEERSIR